MPIYEYRCPHCNKVFEEWVHLSDAQSMVPCPDCGTESPRIISETSFVLRGGGWYVTDYGYRKGIKDEDSKPTTGSTSSSAPKETKAAPRGKACCHGRRKVNQSEEGLMALFLYVEFQDARSGDPLLPMEESNHD